ncbi:EscR/YscR/HrcR family type III secretion system export apparatus protein [Chromatiales bacterium (ex Bugula neritina AB1)]|nr:EscR/YscR/HrcR family type III secretion system export apparatus protein [Chromatiales bacterium (ex Bugula neritina AB1)]
MNELLPDPYSFVILLVGVAIVPFLAVMVTAYAKITVVLLLLRNALGLQQVPPNIVIYAIAITISLFILQPVISSVTESLDTPGRSYQSIEDWRTAYNDAKVPVKNYLTTFASDRERAFFLEAANKLWSENARASVKSDDLAILIPAFIVSELTRAFEIGFLVFLPFIIIDLVVSNILIALGAIMVSPLTISLPIKLFLFVVIDGWTRLIHGLVLSYAG